MSIQLLTKGATYKYRSITGIVTNVLVQKNVATIFLETMDTKETIKKDAARPEEWIHEFQLIKEPDPSSPGSGETKPEMLPVLSARKDNELINTLRDNLMDDIKRVREDKAYIPQAKQACNTTNTLLNLVKIQIQLNKGL